MIKTQTTEEIVDETIALLTEAIDNHTVDTPADERAIRQMEVSLETLKSARKAL
jgi:hypothetical protein